MYYYEELGIYRDAAAGEIRQAYKRAVLLMQPDNQPLSSGMAVLLRLQAP
jgi:DnaJ-class molecular chaperone